MKAFPLWSCTHGRRVNSYVKPAGNAALSAEECIQCDWIVL